MLDGLWIVTLTQNGETGRGVVVALETRLLGGDGNFTYVGTFRQNGAEVTAEVLLESFDPSAKFFGVSDEITLTFELVLSEDDELIGTARTPLLPDPFYATLRRKVRLP
jgi:hypothetical protein